MISIITPALVKDAHGLQWLHEAIASVAGQTTGNWEMIVVDDHSPVDLGSLKSTWPEVTWLTAEGKGVSAARNQAAEAARGDLLLPLDADDKLAAKAVETFWANWTTRGEAGILYSDVVMFGQDYAQVYLAPEYNFPTLLHATYMTVGCLHRKADWERIGGWRLDMTQGLEDWEYWITMGEAGVCGKRIPEPLYWYRRHPRGRLQWLKSNHDLWDRAYQAMREIHRESYNGRYPMGCCGGNKKAPGARRPLHGGVPRAQVVRPEVDKSGLVQITYRGPRKGGFEIVGGVTRTRYGIPGQGQFVIQTPSGIQGVKPADVPWFRSVAQGRDFQIVEPPKAAPAVAAPKPAPAETPREKTGAWEPAVMEPVELPKSAIESVQGPATGLEELDADVAAIMKKAKVIGLSELKQIDVPNLESMTVAEIKELEIGPGLADLLLVQEQGGKGRKTVLEYLERLAE